MSETSVANVQPKKPPFGSRDWRKRLLKNDYLQSFASAVVYQLMRFSHATHRHMSLTADAKPLLEPHAPVIIAMWHGQHFMVPLLWPKDMPIDALISKSSDAEINARVLNRMGIATVRGSGGRDSRQNLDRGGAKALLALKRALSEGRSVAFIADISHGAPRQSGEGIVTLARLSGRPIVPVAYATSNHYIFKKSWDKSTLNLPFGKRGFAVGTPIYVSPEDGITEKQLEVTSGLNAVTRRAAIDAGIKGVSPN